MPQELRIVKCYKCLMYQVDIVKKDKKWGCKMCGAKQTLKQEFGRGSGLECRKLVQKLNMGKQELETMAHDVILKIGKGEIDMPDFGLEQNRPEDGIPETNQCDLAKSSKWGTFVEPADDSESDLEDIKEEYIIQSKYRRSQNNAFKRKSYPSTEENPHDPVPSQTTSTFFNFNKKSKFELADGSVLSQCSQLTAANEKLQNETKPSCHPPKTKLLNPNSKWGNFLNNSDEDDE